MVKREKPGRLGARKQSLMALGALATIQVHSRTELGAQVLRAWAASWLLAAGTSGSKGPQFGWWLTEWSLVPVANSGGTARLQRRHNSEVPPKHFPNLQPELKRHQAADSVPEAAVPERDRAAQEPARRRPRPDPSRAES